MGCVISGLRTRGEVTKDLSSRSVQESSPEEGDRPVGERHDLLSYVFPSIASPVEPGVNPGGPPPKAKYSSTTGSVTVARVKNEKYPC